MNSTYGINGVYKNKAFVRKTNVCECMYCLNSHVKSGGNVLVDLNDNILQTDCICS